MLELTVTIATFKRAELLDLVLSGFVEQSISKESFEIIVCDSNSGNETNVVIEKYRGKLNLKHHHTKNVLAAKRNLGIEKATADFVIFMDDDCVPERNFIKKYLELKGKKQKKTIYCGEVRFPKEWVAVSSYYKFRDSLHPKFPVVNKIINFNNIVVMNMGFWKEEFLKMIGGVNENFVGYGCEDIELGWRLKAARFHLTYDGPTITHRETSAGISGYMVKIHRASRDGMKALIQNLPEAAFSLKMAKLLEPNFNKNKIERILGKIIISFAHLDTVNNALVKMLDRLDGVKIINFKLFYRYLMLVAATKGIEDRNESLTEEFSANGWY